MINTKVIIEYVLWICIVHNGLVKINAIPTTFDTIYTCPDGQYKSNSNDCGSFFMCDNGIYVSEKCPGGLHFNPTISVCDWPNNANCTTSPASTTPSFNTTDMTPIDTTFIYPTPPVNDTTITSPTTNYTTPSYNTTYSTPNYNTTINTTTTWYNTTTPSYNTTTPGNSTTTPGNTTTVEGGNTNTTFINTNTTPSFTSPIDNGTTIRPPIENACPPDNSNQYTDLLPHPDCTKFYMCSFGIPYEFSCPEGQNWSVEYDTCDYIASANCVTGAAPEQPGAVILP